MPIVDSLDIQLSAQATKANAALDNLVNKLDAISASLGRVNGSGMIGLANGVSRLVSAMQGMKNVRASEFTRLARGIEKLSNLNTASINKAASSLTQLTKSFSTLNNISTNGGAAQIASLAKGIAQLGYKSATQAIQNIPQLAMAMKNLMQTLSTAPQVSQNLISMTNSLARLARTGASSGKAANSLSKSLNTYSASANKAKGSSFSLASAIGKLYATYWMLLRAFNLLGDAIDISSDLTEVQNVVDVTFGKYSALVDKMAETSIVDFGMSELTVKQISSRFQAMGTAMGFAQGKMADMSLELTALAADMASFYNVEQSDVAEDLESIFTGQTRPLRSYGLDLTEATLKEWAMKQGIDANIDSMSQAEKTMLRYQYVMANTGAAQGDFARTAGTWANQVRILKQNFEQLGSVIGGSLINALKPLVTALNYVMSKLIAFAKVVSDSLGKIFGWTYEASGSGGVASDFEDAADAASDLSSGSGSAADNLGSAADNAKKLKNYLLGIDELNVISQDDSSSSGSGGSGGSGGVGSSGAADASGGQWVKTESIWESYESELDTLYKLGEYIGKTITNALNDIDWKSAYQGARNFGTGLADFLNGLISPELFGAVGRTIASSLNTAIYAALAFGKQFDFYEFGQSIATGINEFFNTFDFGSLAETLNVWVDGLEETIRGFLDTITWDSILIGMGDFLGTLELDTVEIIIGAFLIKNTNLKSLLWSAIKGAFGGGIKLENIMLALSSITIMPGTPAFDVIGTQILEGISSVLEKLIPDWALDFLSSLGGGIVLGAAGGSWFPGAGTVAGAIIGAIVGALDGIKIDGKSILSKIADSLFNFDYSGMLWEYTKDLFGDIGKAFEEQDWLRLGKDIILGILSGITSALSFVLEPLIDLFNLIFFGICDLFGIHSPAKEMEPLGKNILLGLIEGFVGAFGEWFKSIGDFVKETRKSLEQKWGDVKLKIGTKVDDFKKNVSEKWDEVKKYWKDKKPLEEIQTTYQNIKSKVSEKWDEVLKYWKDKDVLSEIKGTYESFRSKIKEKWDDALEYWSSKTKLSDIIAKVADLKSKLSEAWEKLRSWWNNNKPSLSEITAKIKMPHLQVTWDTTGFAAQALQKLGLKGFPNFSVSYYQSGGFPDRADLFFANEHGIPELIGTMGGKTAVASGMEITGISDAVYSTGQTNASLLSTAVNLLQIIADKELVQIGDKEIARANNRGQKSLGLRLITEV